MAIGTTTATKSGAAQYLWNELCSSWQTKKTTKEAEKAAEKALHEAKKN